MSLGTAAFQAQACWLSAAKSRHRAAAYQEGFTWVPDRILSLKGARQSLCSRLKPFREAKGQTRGTGVNCRSLCKKAFQTSVEKELSKKHSTNFHSTESWVVWKSGRNQGCVACSAADSEPPPLEEEEISLPDIEGVNQTVAIKLPGRRTLQVSFTCNACGTRSTRLVNPFAFQSGTVFVQCAGCEKYHQLVDNLGLIKEYNLKDEQGEEGR